MPSAQVATKPAAFITYLNLLVISDTEITEDIFNNISFLHSRQVFQNCLR